jgi:hypothetical protein
MNRSALPSGDQRSQNARRHSLAKRRVSAADVFPENAGIPVAISYRTAPGGNIRPRIQFIASLLFQRHISDCSDCRSWTGQVQLAHHRGGDAGRRRTALPGRHLRQAEVQDICMAMLGHEDVFWSVVVMNNSFSMRCIQAARNASAERW